MATEAIAHAGTHAFAHRKDKKSNFRRLWNIKINAEVRKYGLSYSRFMDLLNKKEVKINRKMLADMAENTPDSFKRVVDTVK